MAQTFGKYTASNSIIHRIHPTLKFLLFILTIVMIFLPNGFAGYIVLSVWVIGVYALARVGWRTFYKTIRSCIILFVVVLIINWLTMNGDVNDSPGFKAVSTSGYQGIFGDIGQYANHKYGSGRWLAITDRAIYLAIYVTIKIFFMIIIASVLTSTTTSLELTTAIEDILRPLRWFRLPVTEIAMIISIALRFVPSLVDEAQRILKAQASRGIDASNGNWIDKINSIISLIVPLFSIAFQKAEDLGNAMEARSYNPRYSRTKYRIFKVRFMDFIVLMALVAYLTFMISWVAVGFFFVPFGNAEAIVVMGQGK